MEKNKKMSALGGKTILVTGGAGFIGSTLVDRLIEDGHSVVVVDNLTTGCREYVNPNARFYEVDICDKEALADVFTKEQIEYVYHVAAQIDVRVSVENPVFDNKINLLGGLNVLEQCRVSGVKKIIFTSTGGAIYGETDDIPTPETCPTYPLSPYGIHKLTFEKYLRYYAEVYGQDYSVLRFSNVYGPRQFKGGEAGVISIFIDHAVHGGKITINGDGLQTRDFVYVGDVVEALVRFLVTEYHGEVNISLMREDNLLDIVHAIETTLDMALKVEHIPAKVGEQRRSCLDNSLAKKILGWEPKVGLEEGIKKTIEWSKS